MFTQLFQENLSNNQSYKHAEHCTTIKQGKNDLALKTIIILVFNKMKLLFLLKKEKNKSRLLNSSL